MPADERNRTIRLTIDMTYNAEQMHHDDPEGIRWFNEEVLGWALQMWSDEIGDWIGSVRIVEPPANPNNALGGSRNGGEHDR